MIRDGKNIVTHAWGQSPSAVFNGVVDMLNSNEANIAVLVTNKKFGAKKLQLFLEEQGLEVDILKRGAAGLRELEVHKPDGVSVKKIIIDTKIVFECNGHEYSAVTGDALFSKQALDAGSRYLLQVAGDLDLNLNGKRVADFGCGWGALSLILSHGFPSAEFYLYDIDQASLDAALQNFDDAVTVQKADLTAHGFEPPKKFDLIISNPPFHITDAQREQFFRNVKRSLVPEGQLLFVAEQHFTKRFTDTASSCLELVATQTEGKFTVLQYTNAA